jgi:hypothetical protein
LFFLTGGWSKLSRAAGSLSNPLSLIFGNGTSTYSIQLPWQASLTQGPDISQYTGQEQVDGQRQVSDTQQESESLLQQTYDAKSFGDPSPYRGEILLSNRTSDPEAGASGEYIEMHASSANSAPVQITGWSLQSVLSGARVAIPPASSLFILGVVNPVRAVLLNPGASAIVNTGVSPVGVSFRENVCSGYLAQYQTFSPDLENYCPDPKSAMPEIPENLQRYGASCFTFVQSLSSCRFPGSALPSTLSSACRSFVVSTYSYNGCVNMYQFLAGFNKNSWRLFIGSPSPLWNSEHDIIRLLDAEGRTVDVLTY